MRIISVVVCVLCISAVLILSSPIAFEYLLSSETPHQQSDPPQTEDPPPLDPNYNMISDISFCAGLWWDPTSWRPANNIVTVVVHAGNYWNVVPRRTVRSRTLAYSPPLFVLPEAMGVGRARLQELGSYMLHINIDQVSGGVCEELLGRFCYTRGGGVYRLGNVDFHLFIRLHERFGVNEVDIFIVSHRRLQVTLVETPTSIAPSMPGHKMTPPGHNADTAGVIRLEIY